MTVCFIVLMFSMFGAVSINPWYSILQVKEAKMLRCKALVRTQPGTCLAVHTTAFLPTPWACLLHSTAGLPIPWMVIKINITSARGTGPTSQTVAVGAGFWRLPAISATSAGEKVAARQLDGNGLTTKYTDALQY